MSHQTIHHRQKKIGQQGPTKRKRPMSPHIFFNLSVSVVGKNAPIWLSHSTTIKEYKSLFFLSLKDIKLMYYVIHYDPTLLHQTNEDNNKVYEKKSADFYSN